MSVLISDVDPDELAMVIGRAVLSRMTEIGMELDDVGNGSAHDGSVVEAIAEALEEHDYV